MRRPRLLRRLVAGPLALLALSWPIVRINAQDTTTLRATGLEQPVEILRDRWGINHIYARTENDLFLAQGWSAARDRLFQLEVWRRQATGTVAELLGPRELPRDIGARLFRFRGDLTRELNHYHPHGAAIIGAFVRGINAYIDAANAHPESLPLEFRLLGTRPEHWTEAVVISRHQGLLGNLTAELEYGRAVAALGAPRLMELQQFGPATPDLTLDPSIDAALLSADILAPYNAFRAPLRFRPEDVVASARATTKPSPDGARDETVLGDFTWPGVDPDARDIGSNNWVVSARLSESGYPLLANDPHRAQSAPSLRYWTHLVAPGWNVIGGGEPVLPGVSIGHNEYGAWGLTIFATDGEDLLVYDTDASDPDRYRYKGQWERMTIVRDTVPVKGRAPEIVMHRYTRHGPVVYRDSVRHKAFAVRAAWMETGGAPYLASLRLDQARTWEEFRAATNFANIPGENMIWADRTGAIGWQSVGIAPNRRNFSGLVPEPGDGRFEWDGYLEIVKKPHIANPAEGFFASANNDLIPRDFPDMQAIGFEWSDPYRWARASELLATGRRQSISDMARMQTDELSIPARQLVPLLRDVQLPDARTDSLRQRLLRWDFVLAKESAEGAMYNAWENAVRRLAYERLVHPAERKYVRSVSLSRTIGWLVIPPGDMGQNPLKSRDSLLVSALVATDAEMTRRFGRDISQWTLGSEKYKHALLLHPLSGAVNEATRRQLEVGPLPRGGNANTLNATGNADNQTAGASFRIVVDLADWDRALGTNTPGQSGDPASPHYRDLFEPWALNRFFPVFYTKARVDGVTESSTRLEPASAAHK